ncbi:DivIVA domain-containing protein [Demequina mangrovi]|uniref:Cell wall synthesis protein Wag31 n=1 Tax=Demequina mangrovi TaxID=1043493 RepID=A0A1H6Z493_9MICO|nr:DivIVA domain-containing protein [Demequina mangrovi]SEJ46784.1 DivIVA domain-containing protein [Demequina mangrovi]
MALLTAEDVLNKAFSKTKYREGFDQDEVDDFLDEVAATISQLTAERDELAAKVESGGGVAAAAPTPEPSTDAGLLQAATDPNPPTPTGMLAMAQKLHDEYVAAGEEEKERLVEEGKAKAESIVERAETDATARMEELNAERSLLETKIDDLRRFERDYRARLKSYLSNLLGDLDHAEGTTPAPVASYVGEELLDETEGDSEPEAAADEDFAGEEEAETDAPAEDDEAPEQPQGFAPVTGMTPKVAEAPYQPQSTQFGTPYTPQNPWNPTPEGGEEQR